MLFDANLSGRQAMPMSIKGAIVYGLIVLALLSVGAYVLLSSVTPLEKESLLLDDSFSVAGREYENKTVWADSSGEYSASFTVTEGTINATLMVGNVFSLWTEGLYQPDWVESDQANLGAGMALGQGESAPIHFVFWNNDTLTKQVHLEASKMWKETNYVSLLGGTGLILSGIIMCVISARRSLNRLMTTDITEGADIAKTRVRTILGDFAVGFLTMTTGIGLLYVISFAVWGYFAMWLLLVLILWIPLSIIVHEYSKREREKANWSVRLRRALIAAHGTFLASWAFDVGTTYYAIDVLNVAAEQNPLGWPMGALGALVFYLPALILIYVVLYRIRQKYSLAVATIITVLAAYLAIANLFAGFQNLDIATTYFLSPSTATYNLLFFAVILVDLVYALLFRRITKSSKP